MILLFCVCVIVSVKMNECSLSSYRLDQHDENFKVLKLMMYTYNQNIQKIGIICYEYNLSFSSIFESMFICKFYWLEIWSHCDFRQVALIHLTGSLSLFTALGQGQDHIRTLKHILTHTPSSGGEAISFFIFNNNRNI